MTMDYYAEIGIDSRVLGVIRCEGALPEDGRNLVALSTWERTPRPSDNHAMFLRDGAVVWEDARSLDEAKIQAWDRIKAARAAAETAPLTVEGRTFDATDISQRQIAGAVQLALIAGPTFTVDWTLADNTSATLTQAEIIAVGVALGQRTAAVYSIGRGLRAQIESAITVDQVDSVSWPSE
jgi:hypothetical protein